MKYSNYQLNEIYKRISKHTFDTSSETPPIACVLVRKSDGRIIYSSRNLEEPLRPMGFKGNGISKWFTHAENKIVQMMIHYGYEPEDVDLFVSFQPCNGCMRMLRRNEIRKVYYLVDKGFVSEEEELGHVTLEKVYPMNSFQRRAMKKIEERVGDVIWDQP